MRKVASFLLVVALLFGLSGCTDSKEIERTEQLIASIGKVSIESESKINAAADAYSQLSDKDKEKVSNYSVLSEAKKQFSKLEEYRDNLPNLGKWAAKYYSLCKCLLHSPETLTVERAWVYDPRMDGSMVYFTYEISGDGINGTAIYGTGFSIDITDSDPFSLARSSIDVIMIGRRIDATQNLMDMVKGINTPYSFTYENPTIFEEDNTKGQKGIEFDESYLELINSY